MAALLSDITENGLEQGDLVKYLGNVATLTAELKLDYTALLADYTAGRAEVAKLVTDITAVRAEVVKLVTDYTAGRAEVVKLVTDHAALITNFNTLRTKLNADAGVTDTDYAAATAATAVAPAAVTAANPAAITAAAPAAVTGTAIAAASLTLNRG